MRKITDHIVDGDSANHQLKIAVLDTPGQGGACHMYRVTGLDIGKNASYEACAGEEPGNYDGPEDAAWVIFQNGPIKEFGVNGITESALAAIIVDRMRSFQSGPFACGENQLALNSAAELLYHLQSRTRARIARGVEGRNVA